MGSSISRAHYLPPTSTVSAQTESIGPAEAEKKKEEKKEKVDYMNLPCPVPYNLLHAEAGRILNLTHCEGLVITLLNILNERFFLKHNLVMYSEEVPNDSHEITKISKRFYAFSAVFHDPKVELDGEIVNFGMWMARVKYNLTNNLSCDIALQMTNEQPTRTSFWCGYKGVTPNLSLGTEVLWQPEHNMSRINFAARYNTNKMIASGRVWNEGAISLSYVQILSEKVSLASEFKYNPIKRYATLRFARGNVDSDGVVSAYIEQKIRYGVKLFLLAKLDHVKGNYGFGFAVNIGGEQKLSVDE